MNAATDVRVKNGSVSTVHQIQPIEDLRWGAFVKQQPCASVFHSVEWLKALHRTYGYEPIVFTTSPSDAALENGLVFCRVNSWLTGQRLVSLPFSDHCEPLMNDPADLRAIVSALTENLQKRNLDYIEMRSELKIVAPTPLFRSTRSYFVHELSLKPDLGALFRNCHRDSTQRKIRRAEREGLVYKEGRSLALLDAFYRLMLITRRRHSVPPQPKVWFRNLVDCLGEAVKIRVAFKDSRAVAAILTLRYRELVFYKYGCSDSRFNYLGGTHLLLWETIREAKRDGLRAIDLGRSDPTNAGLVTFKDRWGATRTERTYLRLVSTAQSKGTFRAEAEDWKTQLAQRVVPYMPDRVLSSFGDFIYRHIG